MDFKPNTSSVKKEEPSTKKTLLKNVNLLHHHDQFERVFIASNQTKFEWEKHVKLINELKERKAKGETNLIIRHVCVISRPTRTANNPCSRGIDHSSQSS